MEVSKEIEIRDLLIKRLRNAGIHVVTDRDEGQSVLNDSGFTTKMQSRLGQLKDAVDFIRKKLKLASSGQTPIQVTEWVHKKTENILGHRIKEHLIDVSGLNHAYNNHGVGGKKLTPNDIPLTKQDIELAPYILMNPDRIDHGTPNSGRESIIYEKTLSNGRIVYIEAEEGLDRQSLVSKNMWANIDPHKLSPFKVADARSEERPHVSTSDNVILDDDRAKIIKDAETAIKNEEILARADKLFVFSDKTIYGFVKNDTIYIDTNELNVETPIHEYAHLWAEALRQQNPEEWKNIVSIMKSETELWNKVKKNYPHLETDDEVADEVLATYSGRQGMKRLRDECWNNKDGDTLLKHIGIALDRFWKNVSSFFGVSYKSADEVADRVFYDLLNEINPLVYTKKGVQKLSDRMILGQKITKTVGGGIQTASKDMTNTIDHTFLHLQISDKLRELMPKVGDKIFVIDDFDVSFDKMNRGSGDEKGKANMIYHSNIRDRFGNRFVCATTKGPIKISEMTTGDLQRLNNILDEKKYSVSKVQVRNDIPETDIRQAERAAVTAVYMRITDSRARRFTDDQISDIRNYHAMFTDETSTTELFSQLFEKALQWISFRCPEKWKTDTLKELNDLADGITREESRGLHL